MFGELPKLFDRNFAVAYILPSAAFVGVTYLIVHRFGLSAGLISVSSDRFFKDLTAFGLLSLLGGVILLVTNRGVVRLLEGYWPLNLGARLNWLELWLFKKTREESLKSDEDIKSLRLSNKVVPRATQNQRNKVKAREANRFPSDERLVLPTSFGNIFRAFESYPRVMYGINAIPGWYRLLAVIPKDYRELIDSSRSTVDFWVNLSFLSLIVIVEFYLCAILSGQISWAGIVSRSGQFPWIPVLGLLSFRIAYTFAKKAAGEWGNWVKSAFDLYLPDLRSMLEFAPATKEAERLRWINFNIAVLTRRATRMPEKTRRRPEHPKTLESLYLELLKLNDQERSLLLEAVLATKRPAEDVSNEKRQ